MAPVWKLVLAKACCVKSGKFSSHFLLNIRHLLRNLQFDLIEFYLVCGGQVLYLFAGGFKS